ncbi:MGH1-like glycoside hydrolase domain-containing protein [Sphingobacterium hungaricum]
MSKYLKSIDQLRTSFAAGSLLLSCFSISCSTPKQVAYDHELQRLKTVSKQTLAANVDEFNAYKGRPESDGPFNASNNKAFLEENIPLFLSSDEGMTKVYNYRWWMVSKHLKEYDDPIDKRKYWVVTEFFGVKPWASLSGAITCPAGHQFYDVRWLRDPKFLNSYAEYFMKGSASKLDQRENGNFLTYLSRPESHHFSSWMIDGVEAHLKIHPNANWTKDLLPYMEKHQHGWDSLFTVHNAGAKTAGMYKILDLYDGMEFSLSAVLGLIESKGAYDIYTPESWKEYYLGWETTGKAAESKQAKDFPKAFRKGYPDYYLVRPSVNSYAYANTQSLANLYNLDTEKNSNPTIQQKIKLYESKAKSIQENLLNVLWNEEDQFFNTYSAGDNEFGVGDYEAHVRESVGYTPWYFNMIPFEDHQKYENAWAMFSSEKGFYNAKGMTTAERQHPYYNEQAYAWNGRGWPFQNSIVYKAYANYLRNYKKEIKDSERELLFDYIQKLANMHGSDQLNIGEWYIPSDGQTFGGEQDYFHSTFPDIVIEDLLGFKASHENKFTLEPLLPEDKWDHFYLGNLRYHGHDVDVIWKKDWDTNKPGDQSMLCVWVNNKLVSTSPKLNAKLEINLPK